MERVILHSDLNNFYASVECLYRPELKGKDVAVTGCIDDRRGIILAKNTEAKKKGVKTGEVIWQAKLKSPDLICLPPNFSRYIEFSKMARGIYEEYTDQVENFGLDECWLDVSGSAKLFGGGKFIADEIRRRIENELGITASIGVSFNKIFAKLGSDMKKPDATTVIPKDGFEAVIGHLDVQDLLLVGRATKRKLDRLGIHTIGQLGAADAKMITRKLGKMGKLVWQFANGIDYSPVKKATFKRAPKSIGNSTTLKENAHCIEAIKPVIYRLAESVATRMREYELKGNGMQLFVKNSKLEVIERQMTFLGPTYLASDLVEGALLLLAEHFDFKEPIRAIGITAIKLVEGDSYQMTIYETDKIRQEKLEISIDEIRQRFGNLSLTRGIVMTDDFISNLDIKESNVVFPVSYFR